MLITPAAQNHSVITGLRQNANARRTGFGWTSVIWSGYAIAARSKPFTSVSAEWNVPLVLPSSKPAYSSAWIGIDGFRNDHLIQTGTGHEYVNGTARYYAWWEILPAAETVIPRMPVYPGDRFRACIRRTDARHMSITLSNLTRGCTFRTVQRYYGPRESAEWIVEAPQIGASVTRLARLAPVYFSNCKVSGASPRLHLSDAGILVQNGRTLSVPSRPNRKGNAFVVKSARSAGGSPLIYSGRR